MAALPASLVLFVYFTSALSYTLLQEDEDENQIVWPTEYHFKGETLDFLEPLKETFEIWYSADLNRSRIDHYDGTVRKWYYADTGYAYEIHPITNEEVTNKEVCKERRSRSEQPDFLPYTDRFIYTGQSITLYDKVVDVWSQTETYGRHRGWESTLYVFKTDSGIDLPVQEVKKEYDYDVGKLVGHTITNYYDFRDAVTEEELTVDNEDECESRRLGEDFHEDMKFFHPNVPSDLDEAFELYTNHHNKQYQDEEHLTRKQIFERNWRMVDQHNRKNLGYKLELNAFSDKTEEELKYLSGTYFSSNDEPDMMPFPHTLEEIDEIVQELPESFDLRMEGSVTPIKNQGSCGSCWAFCTTAAIEGALARTYGERLLDLSEQSLVDCAWGFRAAGCSGGFMEGAMRYVLAHGIPTEENYGVYQASDGYCKIQNMTSTYKIRGFARVTPRNPNALKVALFKYGPVTVGVRIGLNFMHYSNGLLYDTECVEHGPGHCVTAVGYGVRDGEDYWIIKNSWGETWGEDGYVLMSARNNNCYLLDYAHYPIV